MRTLLIVTAVFAATASPTLAQTAADRADARCILVLTLAARNPAQKDAAGRGQFYYQGRFVSRSPTTKLGHLLVGEAKVVTTPQQLQAELARCGAELTVANTALRDGLKAVEAAAQQVPPGAAPPK